MKRMILILAIVPLIAFGLGGCGSRRGVATRPFPPYQRAVVDISIFYDELAPYGNWFQLSGYGWVWTPYGISVSWRPYTYGYWVWTDFGWTWVSRYNWGWGPFHYGRWFHHHQFGWVWIPGTVWGPGWVAWRHGPGWVGWAPLPPEAGWRAGFGLAGSWDDLDRIIEPHWYSFVEERYLADRDLERRIELPARNVTIINSTRNVTRYEASGNRVIDRSIDVGGIERSTGRAIPRYRVVDPDSSARVPEGGRVRGNDVMIYRPDIGSGAPARTPREAGPSRPYRETDSELMRRQEEQRRRLEAEQAREREATTRPPRAVKPRPETPPARSPDQVMKHQENERRAFEQQVKREQELLRQRQEAQRKASPAAPARQERPKGKAPERKPVKP